VNEAALARKALTSTAAWHPIEFVFWIVAAASWWLMPDQYLLLNDIAITALFALSLDLVLGYGGIVSLGHAAFFGLGAYTAGILAKDGFGDPLLGLGAAAAVTMAVGLATSLLVLRGSDLTRIMVTLSVSLVLFELANKFSGLTGGADGLQGVVMTPILGLFEFDIFGSVAFAYSLAVLFVLFLVARVLMASPYGLSVRAVAGNPLRASAIGIGVNGRLIGIYTVGAVYAGVAGALLAQTTQFVSLDVLAFHRSADIMLILVIGGTGYLYGGMIGAVLFKLVQDWLANLTPQYWEFWIGLFLVALVVVGRERMTGWPMLLWRRVRPV
jgi:branched-chain amino acid transport system permease protein